MVSLFRNLILLSVIVFTCADIVVAESRAIVGKDTDFLIKKWTTEDGLPGNTVTSIVQTDDGYIWLSTFGGLARFDGIKFTVFDSTNAPGLASNRILSLYEDRWKRLWIGTESGEVYTLINGRFIELKTPPEFKRMTVWQFIEDDAGSLFIGSDSGLERIDFAEDGKIVPESLHIVSRQRAYKLAKGPGNSIWTSSGKGYEFKGDQVRMDTSLPKNIVKIDFSDQGRMFVGTINALGWMDNGSFTELLPEDNGGNLGGYATKLRPNELWFQKGEDLFVFRDGKTEYHNIGEYVKAGSRAMFFDKEDNLWLATESDGLVRLTKRKLSLIGDLTDLNVFGRYALIEDAAGAVWVAGHDLMKVQDGIVESIQIPDNVTGTKLIQALAIDKDNVLWAGGLTDLYTLEGGKLKPFPKFGASSINSLFFDRQDTLWIGSDNGLWKYSGGQFAHYTTADGLAGNGVHYLTQTSDGSIWVGTMDGASKFKDGKFENFAPANGLSGNYVREILEDADGTLWIGTYGGGINRLRDGQIQAITTAQGLQDNFVSRILVDDNDRFWVLGNLGIFSVARDDLNAVADQRSHYLVGALYGVLDGMKSSEASGGHQSAGIKTRDGRLWFPMIKDVVIIDPKLPRLRAPQVVIEHATSRFDSTSLETPEAIYDTKVPVQIENGSRNLEIQFTGLSFTKPEKLHFYYKLEGLDSNWIDAGSRRSAFYPYLPSGNYTFMVKAVNADGVWSESTANLKVDVAKRFWQTWWFVTMVISALVIVAVAFYSRRLRGLEARNETQREFSKRLLNAHESERQRLASELHDGLGQDLLIIKNWAKMGLSDSAAVEEMRSNLRQIAETASGAIDETRTIVGNLSPQNLKRFGLTAALRNMADQIELSTGIRFECNIESIDGLFSEETEVSIYRIVQECLNNIAKHSESPRATVAITRIEDVVLIAIEDFGRGFEVRRYTYAGSDVSGFGLQSLSQRVKLIGGQLSIKSRISEGTQVSIWINT